MSARAIKQNADRFISRAIDVRGFSNPLWAAPYLLA
jgi:hypothetical protein